MSGAAVHRRSFGPWKEYCFIYYMTLGQGHHSVFLQPKQRPGRQRHFLWMKILTQKQMIVRLAFCRSPAEGAPGLRIWPVGPYPAIGDPGRWHPGHSPGGCPQQGDMLTGFLSYRKNPPQQQTGIFSRPRLLRLLLKLLSLFLLDPPSLHSPPFFRSPGPLKCGEYTTWI